MNQQADNFKEKIKQKEAELASAYNDTDEALAYVDEMRAEVELLQKGTEVS